MYLLTNGYIWKGNKFKNSLCGQTGKIQKARMKILAFPYSGGEVHFNIRRHNIRVTFYSNYKVGERLPQGELEN